MTEENSEFKQEDYTEDDKEKLFEELNKHMEMCDGMHVMDILRLSAAMSIDVIGQIAKRHGQEKGMMAVEVYKNFTAEALERMVYILQEFEKVDELASEKSIFDAPKGVQ